MVSALRLGHLWWRRIVLITQGPYHVVVLLYGLWFVVLYGVVWSVALSLINNVVYRIGLMDCPRVEP